MASCSITVTSCTSTISSASTAGVTTTLSDCAAFSRTVSGIWA